MASQEQLKRVCNSCDGAKTSEIDIKIGDVLGLDERLETFMIEGVSPSDEDSQRNLSVTSALLQYNSLQDRAEILKRLLPFQESRTNSPDSLISTGQVHCGLDYL